MAQEPFLTLPVRSCRDLLQVRQRARQIAQLLRFSPHETICIAAGAFVVALQAKNALRRAQVCFALADRQLRVFSRRSRPVAQLPENLYTLVKTLPHDDQQLAQEDIVFLLGKVGQLVPTPLLDEVVRQNQEVLALLAALQASAAGRDPGHNPNAA